MASKDKKGDEKRSLINRLDDLEAFMKKKEMSVVSPASVESGEAGEEAPPLISLSNKKGKDLDEIKKDLREIKEEIRHLTEEMRLFKVMSSSDQNRFYNQMMVTFLMISTQGKYKDESFQESQKQILDKVTEITTQMEKNFHASNADLLGGESSAK